jgi:Raf kinase inhibitor-like YbhB/YbcL family protein
MGLELTSTGFRQGEWIPSEYTAEGRNVSPPLNWSDLPGGTKTLALVCEDPDAPRGTFTHWVIFNIPAESRELAAGVPTEPTLPNGAVQGANDFGRIGYSGPAPPPGKAHRYSFKLYALDTALGLPSGASPDDLKAALSGHVLAEGQLMGTYGR